MGGGREINKRVFLAILEDRHFDDSYLVSATLENAINQCKRWQAGYDDRYIWHDTWPFGEECWIPPKEWPYYAATECEDGPKTRVEIVIWEEVQTEKAERCDKLIELIRKS